MKEIITSRQNPRIKAVCALLDKKARRETGCFRFDGIKLLGEALEAGIDFREIYVREPMSEAVNSLLTRAFAGGRLTEEQIFSVSESVFEKLSEEKNPEGVLCVANMPRHLHKSTETDGMAVSREESLLLVQSIRDPGNLGTMVRSCAALGVDRLILTEDCADLYHPKALRSAMGALFRMPTLTVAEGELPACIHALRQQGRRIFAAALRPDAAVIGSFPLKKGDCFVIGNEGHGLSKETVEACNGTAIIPMREGNESLNAAAAAAICIWETVRAFK